MIIDIYIIA